ncbi:PREDICTED: T-cell surface glycoprotein CD5 [Calidris pugnax]|uniref:T-cell surface glycoprotein CD5 n=1 Tax=Calidris pugnax TaxID=198806 RepID=UPI00071D6007|nr:PREDICTED: T-cell surface glycoprotein CD5 [Calidris pugnax]
MAALLPTLRLLLVVGTWAIPGHRGASLTPEELSLRLSGGGCRCAGMLEVKWGGRWNRVCRDNLNPTNLRGICQRLGCGPPTAQPLWLLSPGKEEPHVGQLRCQGWVAPLEKCHWVPDNCTEHVILTCSEPVKTTPKPPTTPPATTPQPTGPPSLQLVEGKFGCSGFVELHKEGLWGAVGGSPGVSPHLATQICRHLHCGTVAAVDPRGYPEPEPESRLPVRWEVVEPCEKRPLFDCFNRTSTWLGRRPIFIICSGSPPQRRLGGGPTPCEGDIEVFHDGRWRVLCDERGQRAQRGQQLCQELRCGNLSSSAEVRDPPATGVTCKVPTLHLCSTSLEGPQTCSRTRIVCQDSKPPPVGTSAGTIMSICLALLLFGVLSLICGPPAYRRLMKRSR